MADSKETKPCLGLIEYSPRQRFLVKEYGLKMDFHIGPDRKLRLFLRTHHGSPFTLAFHGVDALTLTEIKYGNIVFDLVLRNSLQLTTSDIDECSADRSKLPIFLETRYGYARRRAEKEADIFIGEFHDRLRLAG